MEHPDITAALSTGYPTWKPEQNMDTPENRLEYIREYADGLIEWLRLGYPEILDEFVTFSGQVCSTGYAQWLN